MIVKENFAIGEEVKIKNTTTVGTVIGITHCSGQEVSYTVSYKLDYTNGKSFYRGIDLEKIYTSHKMFDHDKFSLGEIVGLKYKNAIATIVNIEHKMSRGLMKTTYDVRYEDGPNDIDHGFGVVKYFGPKVHHDTCYEEDLEKIDLVPKTCSHEKLDRHFGYSAMEQVYNTDVSSDLTLQKILKAGDDACLAYTNRVMDSLQKETKDAYFGRVTKDRECEHKWTSYTGLVETFDFCQNCNIKRKQNV